MFCSKVFALVIEQIPRTPADGELDAVFFVVVQSAYHRLLLISAAKLLHAAVCRKKYCHSGISI